MEPKFKIGDTVCRLVGTSSHGGYGPGVPFVVEEVNYRTVADGNGYKHEVTSIELVSQPSELDDLIEIANKGAQARKQIDLKYRHQVRQVADYQDAFKIDDVEYPHYTIIKKAVPMVEPPKLVEGWSIGVMVGPGPTQVHVGCITFDAHYLRLALETLLRGHHSYRYSADKLYYYANRHGVELRGHVLSWPSADLLQKYLAAVLK